MYCIFWLQLILNHILNQTVFTKSEYLLDHLVMHKKGFSVTSYRFNPSQHYSEWVDSNLGYKSVFFDEVALNGRRQRNYTIVSDHFQHVSNTLVLPRETAFPSCSFEIFGFALLDLDSGPLNVRFRGFKPSMGLGQLTMFTHVIRCYYRGLYENWRPAEQTGHQNYWSVVVFCPLHGRSGEKTCNLIRSELDVVQDRNISVKIELFQNHSSMRTTFQLSQKYSTIKRKTNNKMAVCASIPYTSSNELKLDINGAMMGEWVRYHSNLGFKVFVYDRDGSNWRHFLESEYLQKQNRGRKKSDQVKLNLVYHNYTVLGLLDNVRKSIRSDNAPGKVRNRISMHFNTDKTLTSSHCRFEALNWYGIQTILVIDFDEFLFCNLRTPPLRTSSPSLAEQQTRFIHQTAYYNAVTRQQDAVFLQQRLLTNRTNEPILDCLQHRIEALQSPVGRPASFDGQNHSSSDPIPSILDCFSSVNYYLHGHSIKTLHLSHICPLTTYHEACGDGEMSYNCLCEATRHETCFVMHLVTIQPLIDRANAKFNRYNQSDYVHIRTELWDIANLPFKPSPLVRDTLGLSSPSVQDTIRIELVGHCQVFET